MERIILSEILSLPELLTEYMLTDYKLVDLSVGRDEQVYLLFARKIPARIQEMFVPATTDTLWCAIVLMIDWQTGESIYHRKLDFGKQTVNFHFIQPIEDFYLLLGARSKLHRDGKYDQNAVIVDEYGTQVRRFCLGDGIQQCFVDQQNGILTSYFDEGVFGDNPVGNSGLVRWSSEGKLEWENSFCSICDCYAMNLDAQENIWFYYYTDFNLVKTDYENYWTFSPGISGSTGFLLGKDGVSILFQGGYKNQKYYRMQLRGANMTRPKECILASPIGQKLHPSHVAFRKSMVLVLDENRMLYGTNWIG